MCRSAFGARHTAKKGETQGNVWHRRNACVSCVMISPINERTRRVSKYNSFPFFMRGSAACACNAFSSGFVYINSNTWSRTPSPSHASSARSAARSVSLLPADTGTGDGKHGRPRGNSVGIFVCFEQRPAAFDQHSKRERDNLNSDAHRIPSDARIHNIL